eukprot:COSAG04_NODE_3978_length_2383_cov_5.202256_3_plen_94_part_00
MIHDCLCHQVASLALLNNLLELRADSGRLCRLYRRPIPYGASDIGTWYAIFQVISFMAVTTNCGKAQQLDFVWLSKVESVKGFLRRPKVERVD